jgi:hypothetical protein
MSIWLALPFGVGIIAALIAVIGGGRASVITLHIDH